MRTVKSYVEIFKTTYNFHTNNWTRNIPNIPLNSQGKIYENSVTMPAAEFASDDFGIFNGAINNMATKASRINELLVCEKINEIKDEIQNISYADLKDDYILLTHTVKQYSEYMKGKCKVLFSGNINQEIVLLPKLDATYAVYCGAFTISEGEMVIDTIEPTGGQDAFFGYKIDKKIAAIPTLIFRVI